MNNIETLRNSKFGFIGCGEMASAIIKGLISSGFTDAKKIIATKATKNNIEEKSAELGINIFTDNKFLVKNSDVIILSVKPKQARSVLEEIAEDVTSEKLIVSIVAGLKTNSIEQILLSKPHVIRVMPNTPAMIKEGATGICKGLYATDSDLDYVVSIFNTVGKSVIVEENQIDVVTAISGSGPAFFYKIINEFAKSGEKMGLSYEKSLTLAIQTAIGAGKMASNCKTSMDELISSVATEGGCTAVGVKSMENNNINEVLFETIRSTATKAGELGK